MKKLIGKTVKNTSESAHNLHIEFEDGTTLEVGLDNYSYIATRSLLTL